MTDLFAASLENLSPEISVPLSAENINLCRRYADMLVEKNKVMNLTSITDDEGVAIKHFIDSLTLISYLEAEQNKQNKKDLTLADVGTGAGFPGIPVKILMPDLRLTLFDSLNKRVGFLREVAEELELQNTTCVHGRAEDLGRSSKYREKFDCVTARAVANLPVLCEYCIPFVKPNGVFLAMKGHSDEEVQAAKKAIITLGGTLEKVDRFTLPGTDMERSVIVIRKVRPTPPKYPRKAGTPSKDPIS